MDGNKQRQTLNINQPDLITIDESHLDDLKLI